MNYISSGLETRLYSSTPPKAGIKISLKKTILDYTDFGYDYVELESASFREKDITNASFSQSVDITGTELPQMKLSWEQNFFGEVDEYLNPVLSYEVSEKMAVDFSVVYYYNERLSWERVQERYLWGSLSERQKTWGDIKVEKVEEEIPLRRTFLTSRPKLENNKLKWESADLLYFLNGDIAMRTFPDVYLENEKVPTTYKEVVEQVLDFEAERFLASKDYAIVNAIKNSDISFVSGGSLLGKQLFWGSSKDILKNFLSPLGSFLDFRKEGALVVKLVVDALNPTSGRTVFVSLKNQVEKPKITLGSDISIYSYGATQYYVDYDNPYESTSAVVYDEESDIYRHYFYTDGVSVRYNRDGTVNPELNVPYGVSETLKQIRYDIVGTGSTPITLTLYKLAETTTEVTEVINESGNEFSEKNSLNPFAGSVGRKFNLQNYYNKNNSKLDVSFYGDPSLEPIDGIFIGTQLKKDGEENIKFGIVTSTQIDYNGYIRENMSIHELHEHNP